MMRMRLVERFTSRGINPHLVWIYTQNGKGKYAGINRNNDVYGDKYYCFEGRGYYCFEGKGGWDEGCRTVWYPSLDAARKVVQKYLDGKIPHIPTKRC